MERLRGKGRRRAGLRPCPCRPPRPRVPPLGGGRTTTATRRGCRGTARSASVPRPLPLGLPAPRRARTASSGPPRGIRGRAGGGRRMPRPPPRVRPWSYRRHGPVRCRRAAHRPVPPWPTGRATRPEATPAGSAGLAATTKGRRGGEEGATRRPTTRSTGRGGRTRRWRGFASGPTREGYESGRRPSFDAGGLGSTRVTII